MKIHPYPTLVAISASLFFVSCAENPADDTPSAEVTDPLEETAPPAESAPAGESTTYTFTEESTIGFVGSKVTGSHDGGFKKFSGTFSIADGKPGPGPHKIEIDMTSTWSDAEKLTGHLKSPDFFDVEKFPASTFTITNVAEAEGDNAYTLTGDFTLHGVTKKISFPATVKEADDKVMLDAEFDINRKDFGIVYPGKPDDLIRDEVVIKLAMVATPAKD